LLGGAQADRLPTDVSRLGAAFSSFMPTALPRLRKWR
jgi:hypothetical protein